MFICIHIYIYICIYVHKRFYTYVDLHAYLRVYTQTCVNTGARGSGLDHAASRRSAVQRSAVALKRCPFIDAKASIDRQQARKKRFGSGF